MCHAKVEVEMKDNWYEAAIDAYEPSHIVSVVDWASDSSAAPIPEEPVLKGAVYNVFAWGVNDPQEGSRSFQAENSDLLASPIGWHALPAGNDPSSQGRLHSLENEDIINYTTTWGNNVRVSTINMLCHCWTDLGNCGRCLPMRTGKAGIAGWTITVQMPGNVWCLTTPMTRRFGMERTQCVKLRHTSTIRLPSSSIRLTWSMTYTIGKYLML